MTYAVNEAAEKRVSISSKLNPTQEHFLKKYLLEDIISDELHALSLPDCCSFIGEPFETHGLDRKDELPLIKFFFHNFVKTFPFIACNSEEDRLYFWQKAVQPFVKSFNSKDLSNSEEREENITKRRQFSKKFLSGLLLFYNSMFITEQDMLYLRESHLKSSDAGKLDKLEKGMKSAPLVDIDLNDHKSHHFENDMYMNIVAVRKIDREEIADSQPSSWVFLRSMPFTNSKDIPHHHYEFVIQFTHRSLVRGGYTFSNHFISRPYGAFKNLDKELRKMLPGIMANVCKLPHKFKESEVIQRSKIENGKKSKSSYAVKPLKKERLRLALRGYILEVLKHQELVESIPFKKFVSDASLSFKALTDDDIIDYNERLEHEKHLLRTQKKFQTETAKVLVDMSVKINELKEKVVSEPGTIVNLLSEIGKVSDIKKLSPLLQTFNEWCKLEVAATFYQVFLTQDNSFEILNKWKKFHRLFPYSMVYGILRFTNPVKVVSKIMDLLFMNIPTLSLPSWGFGKTDKRDNEPTKHKNLLSMIFILLLDEDLNTYNKELSQLRKVSANKNIDIFFERIDNYVALTYDDAYEIKIESLDNKKDMLLTILTTNKLEPQLDSSHSSSLKDINKSYQTFSEKKSQEGLVGTDIYLNLKQYWQLMIRKKDKDQLKQLWTEPESTILMKQFLTLFYQPLMQLFGKCQIHLVFKDFQNFADEMLRELALISNEEFYFMDSFQVFNRIKSLIDKHEDTLWRFLHNVYKEDDQGLFLGLIEWIERYLVLIRLKFNKPESVTLDILTDKTVDEDLLIKQLESRINKIVGKRRLYQSYLQAKSKTREATDQGKIYNEWEQTNENILSNMDGNDLGVGEEDIQEFNILNLEDEMTNKDAGPEYELTLKLRELERAESYGTSELDKFINPTKLQLARILHKLTINDAAGNP